MPDDKNQTAPANSDGGGVSRRHFMRRSLTGIALTAAGAFVLSAEADARDKATKAATHYQNHPNKGQRCGGCVRFIFPSSCSVVTGTVGFDGWCKLYKR